MKTLALLLLAATMAIGQTATVGPNNSATYLKTDPTGRPVHLRWGAIPLTPGWTLIDYCVGWSPLPGQEHTSTTQGGIVYKGCGIHASGLAIDVFPFLGPQFYVVWAELLSIDGTQVALSADSNETNCDFEVLSSTATTETFYCQGQTTSVRPNPATGLTVVTQ